MARKSNFEAKFWIFNHRILNKTSINSHYIFKVEIHHTDLKFIVFEINKIIHLLPWIKYIRFLWLYLILKLHYTRSNYFTIILAWCQLPTHQFLDIEKKCSIFKMIVQGAEVITFFEKWFHNWFFVTSICYRMIIQTVDKKVSITYCGKKNLMWKIRRSLCFMYKKTYFFPSCLKCVKRFDLGKNVLFTLKTRFFFLNLERR